MSNPQILYMKGIHKSFPGVKALTNIDLELERGDVLALLGANGAGKSTLMKVLSGAYQAEEGEIFFEGKPVKIAEPKAAIDMGINVIYQELNNSDVLSIAENIYMGNLKTKTGGIIDYRAIEGDTKALLERVGLGHYEPFTPVENLSIAEKQMVEIAKALAKNTKVLVLDEPTAALNDEEISILFGLIRQLSSEGTAIIYISHRLDEVFEISNKVMIMRDGCLVKTLLTRDTDKNELITLMVGREIKNVYPLRKGDHKGEIVLEVKGLASTYVKDINFCVRKGEILGLFGLMGAGRTETVETIVGDRKMTDGEVRIEGKPVRIMSPKQAKELGIGYIPSDRKAEGLFLHHSVATNISINVLPQILGPGGLVNFGKEGRLTNKWIQKLKIKTPTSQTPAESLSGGNQQKIVVAKWLAAQPKVLILNEPTRGIDVGAKLEIYNLMNELSEQGISFIMVSSELPEVMAMSDRIVVLHEGRQKGELMREEFSQEKLLSTAIGGN